MKSKNAFSKLLKKLPVIGEYMSFKKNSCYPAGHYYSSIISIDHVKEREIEIWEKAVFDGISGIELQTENQIKLINSFNKYYDELPFTSQKQTKSRYYFENGFYSYTDGIVLYSMIRHFRPKRIIEIGSGFSSALMLDTNDFFFDKQIDLTFIEPYPERLLSLLNDNDKKNTAIIQSDVQKVPLSKFTKLNAGDILFVDSTHVVKTGSDVNYILFEVLPNLQSGVLIHFHDVFYPFEYPKEWVFMGRNWNEDYFLKSFLMYNNKFEIKLFSEYLHRLHPHAFKNMPLTYKNFGANLWIEKK
jgi:predicted O-methyltransferase YrrM